MRHLENTEKARSLKLGPVLTRHATRDTRHAHVKSAQRGPPVRAVVLGLERSRAVGRIWKAMLRWGRSQLGWSGGACTSGRSGSATGVAAPGPGPWPAVGSHRHLHVQQLHPNHSRYRPQKARQRPAHQRPGRWAPAVCRVPCAVCRVPCAVCRVTWGRRVRTGTLPTTSASSFARSSSLRCDDVSHPHTHTPYTHTHHTARRFHVSHPHTHTIHTHTHHTARRFH